MISEFKWIYLCWRIPVCSYKRNWGFSLSNWYSQSNDVSIQFGKSTRTQLWKVCQHLEVRILCLIHLQVPKCLELVQIFCARPKIYLHIVAVTKILWQTKRWFVFSKIGFCASTNVFEEGLNAVKFLGWHKIFGPAQNILGPVKGQGINVLVVFAWLYSYFTVMTVPTKVYINSGKPLYKPW